MEKNINDSGKTLLTGDFNIKVNDPSCSDTEVFTELLDSFGLVNHIQFATQEHENSLDLTITLERETFVKNPSQGRLFSDLNMVLYDVVSTKLPKPPKETRYRKYKATDTGSFGQDLAEAIASLNLDSISPNECVSAYNTTISWILDNHALVKVKKTSSRKKVPWYNQEIADAIRCRRKAE